MASQARSPVARADAGGPRICGLSRRTTEDEVACSICLRSKLDAAELCVTACGHQFCRACLEKALDHGLDSCPNCRADMSRFNIVNRRNGAPLARRDVESIWGTHFVQAGKRGLASLHFAPDASQAWVCYDVKIIPSSWRLDNGQPPPSRKNFADFRYDPVHRVFTGYILWTPSPFSGHVRWDYRMKFDDKFQSIVGGTVRAYRLDGSLGEEMAFGRDIVYRRVRENIFDATYVQMTPVTSLLADYGAMVGHASYHFTRDDAWISYASAPESWKLDSGARIPLKKYFVDFSYDARARIFRGVIDWGQDPIANASRWEYEMHFDPSFRNIASGIVRTVFLDGTVEVHNFGSDIIYTLYEPETSCCP